MMIDMEEEKLKLMAGKIGEEINEWPTQNDPRTCKYYCYIRILTRRIPKTVWISVTSFLWGVDSMSS